VNSRAPTLEDVPAVTSLLNRVADADGGGWVDDGAIANWFTNPAFALEEDAVVVLRDDELVAYADVYRQDSTRLWADLRVPPEERGGDVQRELIRWAESRPAPGARLRFAIPSTSDQLRAELEQLGYRAVRYSFQMESELTDEPEPARWPEGIAVRTSGPDELRTIHGVAEEAFEDHWDHTPTPFEEWEHWMADRLDTSLWFVAMDGDEIAGVCLCKHQTEGRPDVAWVETLGVRRPWRRRGLGEALLRHSFGELYRRGRRRVGLGVDGESLTGAVRLYERVGMSVARRQDTLERVAS
jgi:mycothiol synthase